MKFLIVLFFASLFISNWAVAHESSKLNYNLVSLQESVEVEVENDVMYARVVVRHDGMKASDVARDINIDMQWALTQIRKFKTVKAQTLNYSTYPQYKDRKIKSWSGSQEMSLESKDFDVLSNLIADLQERLQVNNIRFGVSTEKYKKSENGLIADAVKAFKKKAKLIATSMGKKDYLIVNMHVNTNHQYAQPVSYKAKNKNSVSAHMLIPKPGLEAGTNHVKVNVSGQIQSK